MARIDILTELKTLSWLLITTGSSKVPLVMVSHILAGCSMHLCWDVDYIQLKNRVLWAVEFTSPNSGNTTTLTGWPSWEELASMVSVAASFSAQFYSATLTLLSDAFTTGIKTSLHGVVSTTTSETVNRPITSFCEDRRLLRVKLTIYLNSK